MELEEFNLEDEFDNLNLEYIDDEGKNKDDEVGEVDMEGENDLSYTFSLHLEFNPSYFSSIQEVFGSNFEDTSFSFTNSH